MRSSTDPSRFRYSGPLSALDLRDREALTNRTASADPGVREATSDILSQVRENGDTALRELARRFDKVELDAIEVPRAAIENAAASLDPDLRGALERSARNIRRVHEAQVPTCIELEVEPGIIISRRPDPLGAVGVYAPGGTAAYASSVLMGAIPASIAGVQEIVLCSPPGRNGLPSPMILAAASLAGVTRAFATGGAGAIAAMAYGTETVPKVDRIVGPGNAYVAEAKTQLASVVGIDCPAGPSELLVLADDSCNPVTVAREVLAQAEHDIRASVIVVVTDDRTADAIRSSIADLAQAESRREIIAQALAAYGGILVANEMSEAIAFATDFAPEHLLIAARDAQQIAAQIRNAGAVFVGETSSVAFGDYITGANHVLPTAGLGRAYSGLSTLDFIRWTSVQTVSRDAARSLADDTASFAMAEGLPAHASTAAQWRSEQ